MPRRVAALVPGGTTADGTGPVGFEDTGHRSVLKRPSQVGDALLRLHPPLVEGPA